MPRKCERTFAETLLVVGPGNAQALERKANIAALLVGTYPEYQGVLRAIESKALDQMFRILTNMANSQDAWHTVDQRRDRELAGVRLAAD